MFDYTKLKGWPLDLEYHSLIENPTIKHWPTDTWLQKRLTLVRTNILYQNLYNDVKREGDCNGRK